MKGIADTGFLVGFARRNDIYHTWAVSIARSLTEPLLTCEAVVAEASFHLSNTALVLSMIDDGLITLMFEASEHLTQFRELSERYADRKPDFADLCLIRMSELFPDHSVITIDQADFKVYRRNRRDRIPLICPPLN